jgi:Protein of unknown function (DUF3592)
LSLVRYAERSPWLAMLGAWLGFFLLIAIVFNGFGKGWVDSYRLAHDGRQIAATVVKLEPDNHAGCEYSYSVDGRTHTHSIPGCPDNPQVGDHIVVTYDPSHPSDSTLGSPSGQLRTQALIAILVPTVFAALIGRRGIVALLQRRRNRPASGPQPGV